MRARVRGITLVEVLIAFTLIAALIAVAAWASSGMQSESRITAFEAATVTMRNGIAAQYAQEPVATAVTAQRLWDNNMIPPLLRGPTAANAFRGPGGTSMTLDHVVVPGETQSTILRWSFVIPRQPTAGAQRAVCRRWVTALLPHFPYIAINTTAIALPIPGAADATTADAIDAAVAARCGTPTSPTFRFGMLL